MSTNMELKYVYYVITLLLVLMIYLPIVALIMGAFYPGYYLKFPITSYTLRWFQEIFYFKGIMRGIWYSTLIAVVTMIGCVVFGVLGSITFTRYAGRFTPAYRVFVLVPFVFPQLVLGIALLTTLRSMGIQLGWWTAALAHIVWITPVAIFICAIRMLALDPNYEEAARMLGAGDLAVYREVIIPWLLPAMVSAGLFAFIISWDNFVLSYFLAGINQTLPISIQGRMQMGFTPAIPAICTLIIIVYAPILAIGFWVLIRAGVYKATF